MTKFLLFSGILYLLLATKVTAQFSGISITPGGNAASFVDSQQSISSSPNQIADQGNKLGGNGGIRLEWMLFGKENIKLSPEFYFLQKGSKEYYNSLQSFTSAIQERKIDLDYAGMMIPLKIEAKGRGAIFTPYGVTEEDFTILYFQANLFGDYNLGARTNSGDKISFENNLDKIDWGFSAQLGVALSQNVFLQVGYNRGVKTVKFMTENAKTQSTNASYLVNNRNFTVAIVWSFPSQQY